MSSYEEMKFYPINTRVIRVQHDGPSVIAGFENWITFLLKFFMIVGKYTSHALVKINEKEERILQLASHKGFNDWLYLKFYPA